MLFFLELFAFRVGTAKLEAAQGKVYGELAAAAFFTLLIVLFKTLTVMS